MHRNVCLCYTIRSLTQVCFINGPFWLPFPVFVKLYFISYGFETVLATCTRLQKICILLNRWEKGWTLIPNKPSTLSPPHIIVSGCFTSARNNSLAPNTYNMCINREVLFTCQMPALTLLSSAGDRTVWLWVILLLCRNFCAAEWLFRSSWVFLQCRGEEMEVGSMGIIKRKDDCPFPKLIHSYP